MTREVESEETASLRERVRELERGKDAWERSAAEFASASDYYRGLVVRCGEALGAETKVRDDGTVQADVLAAKVPEVTERVIAERDAAQRALAESQAREQELRAAYAPLLNPGTGGLYWMERLEAALERPSDQTALREFGLKVASAVDKAVGESGHRESLVAIVDAVLKGEP